MTEVLTSVMLRSHDVMLCSQDVYGLSSGRCQLSHLALARLQLASGKRGHYVF